MSIYNTKITSINRKHGVNNNIPYNTTLYKKKTNTNNEVLFPLFHYDLVESTNTIYEQDKHHIVISNHNSLIFHSSNDGVCMEGLVVYGYHYTGSTEYNVIVHDKHCNLYTGVMVDVYLSDDGTDYEKATSVKTDMNGLATYTNTDAEYVKFKYNGVWSNEL